MSYVLKSVDGHYYVTIRDGHVVWSSFQASAYRVSAAGSARNELRQIIALPGYREARPVSLVTHGTRGIKRVPVRAVVASDDAAIPDPPEPWGLTHGEPCDAELAKSEDS